VTVRVASHPVFGRSGKNLTLTVPVTFPEAALGADIDVPTLSGSVRLRIPAGTPSGKTFRVRGHGVETADGTTGDLLVTVEVTVPTALSDEEKSVLERLRDAHSGENPRAHLGV
jgi:molecular chaperone DnaJ